MSKAIIVYGSTTGNTEALCRYVQEGFEENSLDVIVKRVEETRPEELKDYDLIFLGCSTWGNGELQDDFISFEEKLRKVDLKGKKAACFGSGETSYPQFCKAVDILEKTLRNTGASIIAASLKIDGDIDPVQEKARSWGKRVKKLLMDIQK